jgi:hypothetical protein
MTLTFHFPHLRHAISRPTRSVIGANLIITHPGPIGTRHTTLSFYFLGGDFGNQNLYL